MKKIILTTIIAIIAAFALNASNTYKSGPYIRAGVGALTNINIGFGYYISEHLSLGVEATSANVMGGYAGVADIRYYIGKTDFRPFADVKAGYGVLGRNIDYQNVWDVMGSAMAGVSWRRIDLGVGATFDAWNDFLPLVNISYTIPFGRK